MNEDPARTRRSPLPARASRPIVVDVGKDGMMVNGGWDPRRRVSDGAIHDEHEAGGATLRRKYKLAEGKRPRLQTAGNVLHRCRVIA